MKSRHDVVIVGGGFGGLFVAKSLGRVAVSVTLLDRRNFHLFQPLLYQVATGGLSPANIAAPLRDILGKQRNARVLLGEVVDVDLEARVVKLAEGAGIPYDTLVVAAGASHHYFGNEGWSRNAPGLKSIEDATAIRRRILFAFEAAERERDPIARRAWLNFVVVGAGPTGVELAGALGELAHDTFKHEFRAIDPAEAQILLVEGADRVLPGYPPDLSARAATSLERIGVTVRVGSFITDVQPEAVTIKSGDESNMIPTHSVLWAAGVRASPLADIIAKETGATVDQAGRIVVNPDLTVADHSDIFVIGDMARCDDASGVALPGVCPVAMQQGRHVARLIRARIKGRSSAPFRYFHKGSLATIGRSAAVADFGRLRFSGWLAWVLWLFVHVLFLIEFRNRLLVVIQWSWSYFTRNRGARLIVGEDDR